MVWCGVAGWLASWLAGWLAGLLDGWLAVLPKLNISIGFLKICMDFDVKVMTNLWKLKLTFSNTSVPNRW